eukprot:COSAG01_NODE_829_length_13273_cov_7.729695_15_plen_193_part_01
MAKTLSNIHHSLKRQHSCLLQVLQPPFHALLRAEDIVEPTLLLPGVTTVWSVSRQDTHHQGRWQQQPHTREYIWYHNKIESSGTLRSSSDDIKGPTTINPSPLADRVSPLAAALALFLSDALSARSTVKGYAHVTTAYYHTASCSCSQPPSWLCVSPSAGPPTMISVKTALFPRSCGKLGTIKSCSVASARHS